MPSPLARWPAGLVWANTLVPVGMVACGVVRVDYLPLLALSFLGLVVKGVV